ncbi:AAA family ATPase [Streptomyces spinoverrucosus]|uniref:LuxR C-terminal-related transcriptional regulator n=1 Tax=Streptomyces spinoverrucosus TaxID=284043 RepID=UPI0018C354A3|nr:LuxR C-terminal-related transcriptional regulator [Streptomyces spinoverrucosus]MBG0850413.1 AAA family ATPase [Streptomyces spinoverrucosus]
MPEREGAIRRLAPAADSGGAPVLQSLISRHSLLDALDRAAEHQVTVVSAPAGSGKTSLLRGWADAAGRDRRIALMTVRPGQADAQLFWLALLSSIRAAAGADGPTEPPPVAPGFNADAMVDKVLSELAAAERPFVFVIDDLHELTSSAAVDQLAALLMRLPSGVHAVVATRHDPPLRLHRLRLAGELAEIRAAQLPFTVDETRELLTVAGITLSDEAVVTLHQRTEGWAAGLRLAALSLAGHPDPEGFVAGFSGSDRAVGEYLMAEMLERQPPEVQRLLLRTSVLDRVNGELADLLTGATGSERILLDLEDANAFVVSLDVNRTWFRYHRLFNGLLRLELRRTAAADIPDLHRVAARWCVEHAETADAIRHLQAAGDWRDAAGLLAEHALSLTLDGQAGTVAELLRSFPAQPGEDFPDLALVHAIADLTHLRLEEAHAHLKVARSSADTAAQDRRQRLFLALASLNLLYARLRGDFDSVFEQVGAVPAVVAGHSGAEVALGSDLRAVALLNLGVTEAWSMRLADSERHLLEGAALARDIGRPYLEVACLAHLGFTSTTRSLTLARHRCEEAITRAARHGWDTEPVIAPALVTLAGTLIWTGAFDHGEGWLERARRVTSPDSEPGLRLLLRLIAAVLPAARGQHHEALAEFAAAREVQASMPGRHALSTRVTAWTIATQARLGMIDEARSTFAALDAQQAALGEVRNAAAAISLAEHDPDRARRELQTILDGTAPVNHALTRLEAHLLDSLASRELGDEAAVDLALAQALNLAEPERLILPFAMTGAWRLLPTLPAHGTSHAALIADILDAVQDGTLGPAEWASPLPAEELSPSELRVLRYLPTNLTRPEIANELSVSPNTVNTHIRRIYAKLGATDRSSAVRRAREVGLLAPGSA